MFNRITLLVVSLFAQFAFAGDVFLNGVNLEGLTNQKFEKVNVTIDGRGNVLIDAPGYSVSKVAVGTEKKEEAVITKKYFLVTEQTPLGMTEYDIDLLLNGKLLRTLRNGDEQIVAEITKHLHPGKNSVMFTARKRYSVPGEPRSVDKRHVFRVIVGEGTTTKEQVVIEVPEITFTRTAADSGDITQEFTLTTH